MNLWTEAEEWGSLLAEFPELTDTQFRQPQSDDPSTWCQRLQLWYTSFMAARAVELARLGPGECVTCGERTTCGSGPLPNVNPETAGDEQYCGLPSGHPGACSPIHMAPRLCLACWWDAEGYQAALRMARR